MIGPFPEKEFLKLLTDLATTPGPSLGEKPRRRVLEDFFHRCGIITETDAAGNLWVFSDTGNWEESVIMDAHLDVVQEGYTEAVELGENRLTGMGVGDNLTAVTMLAFLAKRFIQRGTTLKRPLKLLFSVGEEGLGCLKGIRQMVADRPRSPWLFLAFDLSFEHYSVSGLGSRRYAVTVNAPGGHSWDDFGTCGAIDHVIDFINLFKEAFGKIVPPGQTRQASFNIGTINGGEGINSISRFAEVTLEYRSPAPELLTKMDHAITTISETMKQRQDMDFSIEKTDSRPAGSPVCPERIEPVIVNLLKEMGENPVQVPRSTSINVPLSKGWPSACMGLCRSGRFHSKEEYVEFSSLSEGWRLLEKLCQSLLT